MYASLSLYLYCSDAYEHAQYVRGMVNVWGCMGTVTVKTRRVIPAKTPYI